MSSFLDVLDSLQEEKLRVISESLRVHNPVLCNNRKWLVKYLGDFGIMGVPECLPIGCLQQMSLNLDPVLRLRGTLSGLKLFCEAIILGIADVDTSDFLKGFDFLLPNSPYDGYITDSNDGEYIRYLVDSNELNKQRTLGVTLRSRVFGECSSSDMAEILTFMRGFIDNYVGFHPNCTITIGTGTLSEYVYPQDFNKYFI